MIRSFESMLNLKRWREDEVKNMLALCIKEHAIEEEKLLKLESQYDFVSRQIGEVSKKTIDIGDIQRLQQYSEQLVIEIQRQRIVVTEHERKVDDARALLLDVSKERKTYERLDEKMKTTHKQQTSRKEQNDADERASTQHGRHERK